MSVFAISGVFELKRWKVNTFWHIALYNDGYVDMVLHLTNVLDWIPTRFNGI